MTRTVATSMWMGAVALLLVACNARNGASDLEVGAAATQTSTPTSDGGGTVDGAGSDTPPGPPLPGCGASRVCVPTPDGWTPVASPRNAANACPSTYASPTDLATAPSGDACTCSCNSTDPSACQARVRIGYGTVGCNEGTKDVNFGGSGACTPVDLPISAFVVQYQSNFTGPGNTSCPSASAVPAFQPPPTVRFCGGAVTAPDGCGAGELCVPSVAGNTRQCIVHDGDVSCPTGMTNRTVIGSKPIDKRECSPCACAPDPTCAGTLTSYSTADCSGLFPKTLPYGTCTGSGGTKALVLTASNGCKVTTPSTVSGAITFETTKTLCCR